MSMTGMLRVAALGGLAAFATLTGCDADAQRNAMAEEALQGANARYDLESGELLRLYEYYPNEQVYRSVYHYTYWWQDESGWHSGHKLPSSITLTDNFHELIELPTDKPFRMHAMVIRDHPSLEMVMAQAAELDRMDRMNEMPMMDEAQPAEAFATAPVDDRP